MKHLIIFTSLLFTFSNLAQAATNNYVERRDPGYNRSRNNNYAIEAFTGGAYCLDGSTCGQHRIDDAAQKAEADWHIRVLNSTDPDSLIDGAIDI